jgi:hypothetical protein
MPHDMFIGSVPGCPGLAWTMLQKQYTVYRVRDTATRWMRSEAGSRDRRLCGSGRDVVGDEMHIVCSGPSYTAVLDGISSCSRYWVASTVWLKTSDTRPLRAFMNQD